MAKLQRFMQFIFAHGFLSPEAIIALVAFLIALATLQMSFAKCTSSSDAYSQAGDKSYRNITKAASNRH